MAPTAKLNVIKRKVTKRKGKHAPLDLAFIVESDLQTLQSRLCRFLLKMMYLAA